MSRSRQPVGSRQARLRRIERKCDFILSEIVMLRQQLNRRNEPDILIDRLRSAADEMKRQCRRQRDAAARMLIGNTIPGRHD